MKYPWLKPTFTLIVLALLSFYSPTRPLDPFGLISLQKIFTMIFALAFVQIFGLVVNRFLGARTGAFLKGFFGGLVSSTATTAALAKESKESKTGECASEMMVFLSATLAMLLEAFALLGIGTSQLHLPEVFVILTPLTVTGVLIWIHSKRIDTPSFEVETSSFEITPILKLGLFIVAILILSKLLQSFFGTSGLAVLTFLVSLFEIHGSVIANVQLHESKAIGTNLLSGLLAISISASYISKLFLIYTLGSRSLAVSATKNTLVVFMALVLGWIVSFNIGT